MKNGLYVIAILAVTADLAFAGAVGDSKAPAGQEETTDAIQAAVGEEFVIIFDANKAAGYEWQLAAPVDTKLIKFVSSGYASDKAGSAAGAGESLWTFKAVQIGKTQIYFKYINPREKDAPLEKKATYIVNIQESAKTAETTGTAGATETIIPYSAPYNSPDTGADPVEVVEDAE